MFIPARIQPRTLLQATALPLLAAAALTPSAASAATVTYEGPADNEVLVYRAAPGEINQMSVQDGPIADSVTLYTTHSPFTEVSPLCDNHAADDYVSCHAPNGVRLELGDQNDWVTTSLDVSVPITMYGGPGDDKLEGNKQVNVFYGEDGNDTLNGYNGDDSLDGGAGNDTLDGYGGSDHLQGGPGDDLLYPDHYEAAAPDVVDGGDGIDRIESDWSTRLLDDPEPNIALTPGDGADDGRPGEGDDIRNVERFTLSKGVAFTGTDAPEYVKMLQTNEPSTLLGNGGNDELYGGGMIDTLDGGTGDDILNGGFGDDTITGGPGKDHISGDQTSSECGYLWCKYPYGNDVILARDGEVDSIDCGAGQDRVVADAIDIVAPDCETVERAGAVPASTTPGSGVGGAAGGGAPSGQGGAAGNSATPTAGGVTVLGGQRLKSALRKGLKVSVAAGPGTAPVRIRVTYAGKTVASGSGRPGRTITLRFTKAAQHTLATRTTAKLTLVVGNAKAPVTLAR